MKENKNGYILPPEQIIALALLEEAKRGECNLELAEKVLTKLPEGSALREELTDVLNKIR